MAFTNIATKIRTGDIDIKNADPNTVLIRSNWMVKSPRGSTNAATECLSKALAHGVVAECDPKRSNFFEAVVGHDRFYFHVAEKVGCIYLIALAEISVPTV